MSHPQAIELAEAFERHFSSADREIKWLALEQERQMWLDPQTLLVGRVDAQGMTSDGEKFFGEWKSLSTFKARNMDLVKTEWRMAAQARTYGLLVPETHRFTVRWAIKSNPARCDFEWYTYTPEESEWWRGELLAIAADIRAHRAISKLGKTNWTLNPNHCLRYGLNYACPFINKCSSLDFNGSVGEPRVSHLQIERALDGSLVADSNLVVLDATRTNTWLECHEKYRREYEQPRYDNDGLVVIGKGTNLEGEALTIGTDFHDLVDAYLTRIKQQQEDSNGKGI